MSPGHPGSVQEESSSSTGDGCHGDRPVSARCFTFEEEVGRRTRQEWTTGSDCWDALAAVPPSLIG